MDDQEIVRQRIDNLLTVADRFDHPGGSRHLARRARDKASGMETALRLLTATCSSCGHPAHADADCDAVVGYDHLSGDHDCGCPGPEGERRERLGSRLVALLEEHWPDSGVNGWYLADLLRDTKDSTTQTIEGDTP